MDPTVPDPDTTPTIFGIPLNRILTIARGPINIVAATLASWLITYVHVLGLAHVPHDHLATLIAQGFVWIVTAVLTDRGIAQWVKGHHIQLQAQGEIAAAKAMASQRATVSSPAESAPYAAGLRDPTEPSLGEGDEIPAVATTMKLDPPPASDEGNADAVRKDGEA